MWLVMAEAQIKADLPFEWARMDIVGANKIYKENHRLQDEYCL